MRLLTLTGPGGIGKTHFALELAHRAASIFADGAQFVELAALDDPARVISEIAQELGATEGEGLTAVLGRSELLLVLDNFEQLLDAATDLARLLAVSPRSKLVVTSRAALRIGSEHEFAVPPLPAEPSSELFLRRARALNPRLQLQPGDDERIEQICARLDGLPLAIELAAARTKILSPAAILDRLEQAAGPPERGLTRRAAPPADAARGDRLELRPARPDGADDLRAPRRVHRRLHARGRRGGLRARRARRHRLAGRAQPADEP